MKQQTETGSGQAKFRPKARLVSILGEHLIRDGTVGILELVKNGYDADACTVKFFGPLKGLIRVVRAR